MEEELLLLEPCLLQVEEVVVLLAERHQVVEQRGALLGVPDDVVGFAAGDWDLAVGMGAG